MPSNSPDEPQTTSPNRKPKKIFRRIILALLLLGVGPYLYSRFQAPQNRVQQFDNGGDAEVQRTFDSELSIVSFNIAHGRGTASSNWAELGEPNENALLTSQQSSNRSMRIS